MCESVGSERAERWKSGEKTDHSLVQAAVFGLGQKPVGLLGCEGECEVALGSNVFCNSVCRWSMCVSGVNMCALANKHAHSSTREKICGRVSQRCAPQTNAEPHMDAHTHTHMLIQEAGVLCGCHGNSGPPLLPPPLPLTICSLWHERPDGRKPGTLSMEATRQEQKGG